MFQILDKKEYNRNYYYKRDPIKLDKYRKDYLKREKKRGYDRLKSSVRRAERYFRRHDGRYANKEDELMVLEFRKPKEYKTPWYAKNREQLLEKMNSDYRDKKLKEFVDSVEKKEPKMIGDKIKYINVE